MIRKPAVPAPGLRRASRSAAAGEASSVAAGRESGFTLIEILIAAVIFSVVLAGAGGVVMTLVRGDRYSRTRTASAFELQDRIERFRTMPYAALQGGSAEESLPSGGTILIEWDVTELVQDRLSRIDITVERTPSGHGGSQRAVRVYIANRDP